MEQTRALLVLRINCLAKGHSGISRKTLEQLIEAFNHSCLSFVPQKAGVPFLRGFFLGVNLSIINPRGRLVHLEIWLPLHILLWV